MTLPSSERQARAALSRLVEPADKELGHLVDDRGAEAVLADIRAGHLPGHQALLDAITPRLGALDVDADLAALAAVGGRLVCPGDDEWPVPVEALGVSGAARPVGARRRAARRTGRALGAIVGSRALSDYGEHVATGLAADLADRGWTVVSGGAYGIDAAAHRGALAAGGCTVAVLACGVDVPYPRGHGGLFDAACRDGLLVSELPPGAAPHRHRFLTRNRLIAALACGTVVVEAAIRSGARRTASEARALGRPLMVVPGPVTSAVSAGCHALLREGDSAVLVTSVAEVLEMVGRIGDDLAPVQRGPVSARDELPTDAALVLDAVPARRAVGPARIARTAGMALATVESALGVLALLGLVEQRPEGWRLSAAARAAGATDPGGA